MRIASTRAVARAVESNNEVWQHILRSNNGRLAPFLAQHVEREIVEELQQLRLKYCAAHSTSGLSPDLDLLKETLAGIEKRHQSRRQSQP